MAHVSLDMRTRGIDARARAMAPTLERALRRYARHELEKELARKIAKADDADWLTEELRRILQLYGVRQYSEAGRSVGWVVEPQALRDFLASKEVMLQGLTDDVRASVREATRRLILDAVKETPQPSAGELARRIRTQLLGDGGGRIIGSAQVGGAGVLPTDRLWTEDGSLYAVSSERAALIARTELAQAENSGIFDGYAATGVDEIEWISYRDGKSGDRRHDLMHGKRIKLGEYFTTPLGNQLRYPGDPSAPIKETANCRCTFGAARTRSSP